AVARPERLALVARLDGRLAALGARDALAGRDLLLPARPRGCGPALEVGLGRRPCRVLGPDRRRLVGGAHAPRPELVDDVTALERGVDAVPPGERAQFVIGQRIQAVVSGRPGAGRLLRPLP